QQQQQQHNNPHPLHHQPIQHQQQQMLPPNSRLDSLYDSRIDDRFVPDGMVPGLRQAAPSRNRDHSGMFNDGLDDPMQFNPHRLPPHQRGLDPSMFQGANPALFAQARNTGLPVQPQFRGGPSPNSMQGPVQQRLPPGLANLGARPPHEPAQFMGMQQGGGLHAGMLGNGPSPQQFNNFGANGGLGGNVGGFVGNAPQMRGAPGHQLPNALGHNQMAHLGNMDLRVPSNQAQLLNLGGGPNLAGLRGAGGFAPQQGLQGIPGQLQAPLMALRQQQQQQQHIPPHMMQHQAHHIPPHLQQQGLPNGNTQELMALLMGGSHRD
ncbi:hypothetical protein HWV62_8629, partial [Athelia sp. TMB]